MIFTLLNVSVWINSQPMNHACMFLHENAFWKNDLDLLMIFHIVINCLKALLTQFVLKCCFWKHGDRLLINKALMKVILLILLNKFPRKVSAFQIRLLSNLPVDEPTLSVFFGQPFIHHFFFFFYFLSLPTCTSCYFPVHNNLHLCRKVISVPYLK